MRYDFKIKYEGIDFKKWDRVFRRKLRATLKKAGRKLARSGPLSLRTHLRNAKNFPGRYPDNSPLYKKSKNNRSVLYNIGFLRTAPDFKVSDKFDGDTYGAVDVGFINNVTHPSGSSLQKIVGSIIKGGTWTPTPAQRKAYWAKVGGGNKKTRGNVASNGTYTQPPRDFLTGYQEEVDTSPILEEAIVTALDKTSKATKTKYTIG